MIAGFKTAAEARTDALTWQQLLANPQVGSKVEAYLKELMQFQADNKTALSLDVPASREVFLPAAAVAPIQNTLGYVITSTPTPKPPGHPSNIAQWVRVTKVSW